MSEAQPLTAPDLLEQIERIITELQEHADPIVATKVRELLSGIDAIHRTALTHLIQAIRGMAGDAFINRLISDPAIRLLFMSYDLVAVDRRLRAEEALEPIRGPLHERGVDIEITDVVGGVVYVRIHGMDPLRVAAADVTASLEQQLQREFVGFQQLVVGTRSPASGTAVIPVEVLRHANRPVYRDVTAATDVEEGKLYAFDVEGFPVLLARVGGEVLAVKNCCGATPLPLHFGELVDGELRCSWHGCRYDLRTGRRLDRDGERLHVVPVAIENGAVRVATIVEPNG